MRGKLSQLLWLSLFAQMICLNDGYSQYRREEFSSSLAHWRLASYDQRFSLTMDSVVVWEPYEIGTMAVQAGTGIGAAGVVALLTVAAASALVDTRDITSVTGGVMVAAVGGLATVVAIPTGVYYGGRWSGGNGDHGWTVFAGVVASTLASLPVLLRGDIQFGVLIPIACFSGLAGSLIGYHSSATPVYSVAAPEANVPAEIFRRFQVRMLLVEF